MAYRFTNTDKWSDAWFSELKPIEKLLFLYLCDNCDIAGFIEFTPKKFAVDLGVDNQKILEALKGVGRGLVWAINQDCIFIKNFLKHQKNIPLNEKNNIYVAIMKRFEIYAQKFGVQNINELIQSPYEGASEGYRRENGKGNSLDNGSNGSKVITWRDSFEIYLAECKKAYNQYYNDVQFIKTQSQLNPNINVKLSIAKGFENFWGKEAGWKNKKSSRTKEIDWRQTIVNSIGINKVYYTKQELSEMAR